MLKVVAKRVLLLGNLQVGRGGVLRKQVWRSLS